MSVRLSVMSYDVSAGTLTLEHAYPSDLVARPQVTVDVGLILESLKPHLLQVGSWLNVIGYTRKFGLTRKRKQDDRDDTKPASKVDLQAVLLWSAGSIRLAEYEHVLSGQQEAQQAAAQAAKVQG